MRFEGKFLLEKTRYFAIRGIVIGGYGNKDL